MTKFTPENGGASSSSADSRRLLDVQREPHDGEFLLPISADGTLLISYFQRMSHYSY